MNKKIKKYQFFFSYFFQDKEGETGYGNASFTADKKELTIDDIREVERQTNKKLDIKISIISFINLN